MKNKTVLGLGAVIVGLLFLLLRENEAKVAAQNQLNNLQFKATSVINEKGNAINELESQVGEYQTNLQDCQETCEKAIAAKNDQIQQMNADFEVKSGQHAEEVVQKNKAISGLEEQMQQTRDGFDKQLKKKNTDITEMGEELRKTTERLAKSLKKQESLESENYNLQTQVDGLERQLTAVKSEKVRLETQVKAAQDKPAVLD